MGETSVNINLGDTLPYLEQRFLQLIGKDQATTETASWFSNLQKTAMLQASQVQCIGMHRPLPLAEIYQPTRLKVTGLADDLRKRETFPEQGKIGRSILQAGTLEVRLIGVDQFLKRGDNAVIYAGPGWGKTTFLHHVFIVTVHRRDVLPVLVSLRRPTAVEDLDRFVILAAKIQKQQNKSQTLLLVDGYDELPVEQRKRVSDAILRYQTLKIGSFYLTCREYYQVFEIAAPEVRIDGFSLQDQYKYVGAFLNAFGSRLDPIAVVDELQTRQFEDFLSHPLLLALACIVKTSATSVQSRSVIRLLERAIDVLTYRWDEEKGIDRPQRTLLDGRDRIQVLKRMAFKMKSRHIADGRALTIAKEQLDLLEFDKSDPRQVLMETAQFFGIFVPSEEGWEFVHRTLHDFLAAQFWVETGGFANSTSYEWNARTAYAACLLQDATSVMQEALSTTGGVESFVEILSNNPTFNHKTIADALINYYSQHDRAHYYENELPGALKVTASLKEDFIRLASFKFLDYVVERCSNGRGKTTDTIAGYCMKELVDRGCKLSFVTYEKALALYKSGDFVFHLLGSGHVRLKDLNPADATTRKLPGVA